MPEDDKAKRDEPKLRAKLEELRQLARSIFDGPIRYGSDDHLAFMALAFTSKQAVRADAVLRLDLHPDSVLIVRSMLEGLSQLLWSVRDPQRATRWMAYAHVLDWRLIQQQLAARKRVGKKRQAENAAAMEQYGPWFARKGGDGYRRTWHGSTQRAIFSEVRGDLAYRGLYGPFSAWHHWSPEGFGPMLQRGRDTVNFEPKSYVNTASALGGAFLCLWQSLSVTDAHLNLGHAAAIEGSYRSYMHTLRPRRRLGSQEPFD